MGVKKIVLFPDSRLSTRCHLIEHMDGVLQSLVDDLLETLYAGPGVGVAAPQIGVLKQVSVIDIRHRKQKHGVPLSPNNGRIILINPALVKGEGEQIPREGCLSVPDLLANVRRFEHVTVKTTTMDGTSQLVHSSGFEALALQHEIDHLQGVLFLDRVMNIKTDIFRRKTKI